MKLLANYKTFFNLKSKVISLLVVALFGLVQKSIAKDFNEPPVLMNANQINTAKSSGVFTSITDNNYNQPTSYARDCGIAEGIVSLSLDRLFSGTISGTGPITVRVQLRGYDIASSSPYFDQNIDLTIDPRNTIEGDRDLRESFKLPGAYKMEVKIVSIKRASNPITCPNNVVLEMRLKSRSLPDLSGISSLTVSHKLLDLSAVTQEISSASVNTAYSQADEMEVYWTPEDYAIMYELEWTYVNNYKEDQITYYGAADIEFTNADFESNSTRISTVASSHRIPLIYDKGFVIYRLRALYYSDCDHEDLATTPWTKIACNSTGGKVSCFSPNYQRLDGHHTDINWQRSVSFAEEGKSKEVISYFDGSKRNRQTVTRNNSENITLVAEPIYDYEGRPAVQFLPAPAGEEIKYYDSFNKLNGIPYSKINFDLDVINACDIEVDYVGRGDGASRYYSFLNDDQSGVNAYIPEANRYPFTQTEYEPDNTGRVRRQSGVGEEFKMGSGRETQYFYSTPDQENLDMLFGTDVGYAKHYQKEVVIDPNGQVVMTYKDMAGRVIATGLTGDLPNNMSALEDEGENPLYQDLNTATFIDMLGKDASTDVDDESDRNDVTADSTGLVMNYSFTFPKEHDFSADYNISIPAYSDNCIDAKSYEPVVNLHINVFDTKCLVTLKDVTQTFGTFNTNSTNGIQSTSVSISGGALDNLEKGTYNVIKELVIDEDTLNKYADQYLIDAPGCVYDFNHFLDIELDNMDFSDCDDMLNSGDLDPQDCVDSYNENDYSPEEYAALVAECYEAFTAASLCEVMYEAMLGDVSPGGQYGQFSMDNNGEYYSTDPLSVFNNNSDPDKPNLLPDFWNVGPIPDVVDACSAGYTTINDLIANWDPDWAHSLIQFHPEYNYYNDYYKEAYCNNTDAPNGITTQEYDWLLLNTTSEQNLSEINDYINITTPLSWTYSGGSTFKILTNDPLFGFGGAPQSIANNYAADMQQILQYYKVVNGSFMNIYEYAAHLANYGNWYGDNTSTQVPVTFGDSGDQNIDDKEWNLLKSLYLETKYKYLYYKANEKSIISGSEYDCNTCIGDGDYNPFYYIQERYSRMLPNGNSSSGIVNFQWIVNIITQQKICGWTSFLYKEKERRFSFYDVYNPSNDKAEDEEDEKDKAAEEMYKRTGLCPLTQEIKNLVQDISQNQTITQQISMLKVDAFSPTLYKLVTGFSVITGGGNPTNYVQYRWAPSIQNSGARLSVDLNLIGSGSNGLGSTAASINGFLHLDFQSGSSFSWAGYPAGFTIESVRSVVPNASLNTATHYGFAMELVLKDNAGNIHVEVINGLLKGIDLDNCSASFTGNTAHSSKKAFELESLMNLLVQQGEFESQSNVGLEQTPYDVIFNHTLKSGLDKYNPSPASTYYWIKPNSSLDRFIIRTTSDNDVKYRLFFCSTYSWGASNYYFRNLKIADPNDPAFPSACSLGGGNAPNFSVEVVDLTITNNVASENITVLYGYMDAYDTFGEATGTAGTVYKYDSGFLGSPMQEEPDEPCTEYADVRKELQSILNASVPSPGEINIYVPGSGGNLISDFAFNQLPAPIEEVPGQMQSGGATYIVSQEFPGTPSEYRAILYYGHGGYPVGTGLSYDDELQKYVWDVEHGSIYGSIECNISMEFVEPQNSSYRFNNVKAITSLRGLPNSFVNGVTNQFMAIAVLSDGTTAEVIGESCFQFSECNECTEVDPLIPTNCWADYNDFMTEVVGPLDLEDYQNDFDADDFCALGITCMADYIDYIQAMDVDSESSPYYVTIADFCNHNMGYYIDYYKQYVANMVGGSASNFSGYLPGTYTNQFVLMRDFAINGVGSACIVDYDNYRTTTTYPMDIILYCSGVAYEYPCPRWPSAPTPSFELTSNPCEDHYNNIAKRNAEFHYNLHIKEVKDEFKRKYREHVLGTAVEEFTRYNSETADYQFTLYYFDQAGNLIKTVPPKAVQFLTPLQLPGVRTAREDNDGTEVKPSHNGDLSTVYRYNSLNQVIEQQTPDGGLSRFWYDNIGRLVLSQNAEQAGNDDYSYTRYDNLGRVVEVGQLTTTNLIGNSGLNDNDFPDNLSTTREQVTLTFYDDLELSDALLYYHNLQYGFAFENLRNRVSSVAYYKTFDAASYSSSVSNYEHATHYSYDTHGNVKTVVQDFKGHFTATYKRFKRIDYEYDLVSGNVNKVIFQEGCNDQFIHKYEYDADNRIDAVYTSRDGEFWDRDADYDYYKHGPLARTVLGEAQVQGLDYAYTLQGWLKTVNSSTLNTSRDIGKDGNGSINTPRDAFGFSLHYFDGDYTPINTSANNAIANTTGMGLTGLYNGNIGGMVVSLNDNTENIIKTHGNKYTYDQLNRLVRMDVYKDVSADDNVLVNNSFSGASQSTDYRTMMEYDANGNIMALQRNGYAGTGNVSMDNLDYAYETTSNRLLNVEDLVPPSAIYGNDYERTSSNVNYTYDDIGNLIEDEQEEIEEIVWTVSGKIKEIRRYSTSSKKDLAFEYDGTGNRVVKIVKTDPSNSATWTYTYYVRDASGNVMAVYEGDDNNSLSIEEFSIYGSDRLGVLKIEETVVAPSPSLFGACDGLASVLNPANKYQILQNCTNDNPLSELTIMSGSSGSFELKASVDDITLNTNFPDYISTGGSSTQSLTIPAGTSMSITISGVASISYPGNFSIQPLTSNISLGLYGHYQLVPEPVQWTTKAGDKQYELKNHLGNVLATVADYKYWGNFITTTEEYAVYFDDENEIEDWDRRDPVSTEVADGSLNIIPEGRETGLGYGWTLDKSCSYQFCITITDVESEMWLAVYQNSKIIYQEEIFEPQELCLNFDLDNGDEFYFEILGEPGGMITIDDIVMTSNCTSTELVADVLSAQDYYPFGSIMPGRKYTSESYRYGFNGKEMDNEVSGDGNQYDYGFRIYNPRLGRFLSVDPLSKSYPWYTPYQFAGNKPIIADDVDGMEERIRIFQSTSEGKTMVTTFDSRTLKMKVEMNGAITSNMSITREQWASLKTGLWNTYSGDESYWAAGYKKYTVGMGGRKANGSGFTGYNKGTLNVGMGSKNVVLTFDPNDQGEMPKPVDWSLYLKAIKTFNPIVPISDPNVEGSEAYSKTMSNVKSTAGIVLAGPAAGVNSLVGFGASGSVLNSVDDLSSELSVNGQTMMQNTIGSENAAVVKTGLALGGVISSAVSAANAENTADQIVNTVSGLLDGISTTQNTNNEVP